MRRKRLHPKLTFTLALGLLLISSLVFAEQPKMAGASGGRSQQELLRAMVELVDQNNPLLLSQARLMQKSRGVPEPRHASAVTGLSLSVGVGSWNSGNYSYLPSATAGVSVALGDPARALDILKIEQEKEQAGQDWQKTRNQIITELLDKARQILKMKSQVQNLTALESDLQGYSSAAARQMAQGAIGPDQVWQLRERLTSLQVELQDVKNGLDTTMLQTALSLGGQAWEELLRLLGQLGEHT